MRVCFKGVLVNWFLAPMSNEGVKFINSEVVNWFNDGRFILLSQLPTALLNEY